MPSPTHPNEWATLLRTISRPVLRDAGLEDAGKRESDEARADRVARFRDEAGHRRAVDAPFLAAALRSPLPEGAIVPGAGAPVRAWGAVAAGSPIDADVLALVARVVDAPASGLDETDARLLVGAANAAPGSASVGIEPVTEALLCLCDALWRTDSGDVACRSLRDHLLGEYQPDNATNRPWGIGVFVEDWCEARRPESLMYADGMLTACRVQMGRPDRLSAMILRHAADRLDSTARR